MASKIAQVLIDHGRARLQKTRGPVAFTRDKKCDALLNDLTKNPHAFVIACLMDRQNKAERAWRIPYELSRRFGTFKFRALTQIDQRTINDAFSRPPALHRFADVMARTFREAIKRIEAKYDGDASRIWSGNPSSAEAVYRFLEFRGAGPKIATMAVNILARDFKIQFADYFSVDISADVQVKRVFQRLGLTGKDATEAEVIYRARSIHPEFPGILDLAAWEIGREWCRPREMKCDACYMRSACPSARRR